MERKTLGGFIAALRKAAGMTQKDLAEKLNVSDKSVSRWERDEGAPDLSLIPVIAEVFGVTCDELLRGERQPEGRRESAENASPKAEKQRKRLLAVSFSKYKSRSFIAIGLAVLGLIAAMVCNFGFNRAYIGFFLGTAFYLAAIVAQGVFVNGALLAVADEENTEDITAHRRSIAALAKKSIGLGLVLLGFSLPLVTTVDDSHFGLLAESWLPLGALFALLVFLAVSLFVFFFNGTLFKREEFHLSDAENLRFRKNRKRKCVTVFAVLLAMLLTFGGHNAATHSWDALSMREGTVFHDYESFIAYMEQDIEYYNGSFSTAPETAVPGVFYDENGQQISEEEFLRRELTNNAGEVVCTYIDRNQSVCTIRYTDTDGSLLPITVFTMHDLYAGSAQIKGINLLFFGIYALEIAAGFFIYFKTREK